MDRLTRVQLRAERLVEASHRVRAESLLINAEFDVIEQDPVDTPISIIDGCGRPGNR